MGFWIHDLTTYVNLNAFHDTTVNFMNIDLGLVGLNYEFEYTTALVGEVDHSNDTLIRFLSVDPWQAAPQTLPHDLAGCGAAYGIGANGHSTIFVFGGSGGSTILDSCLGYNITDDAWINYGHMPSPVLNMSSIVCNGKIYVMGSWPGEVNNYIYDMASNSWTTGQAIPIGVQSARAALYKNRYIYLMGGGYGWNPYNNVQLYDILTNTWSQATPCPLSGQPAQPPV